MKPTPEEIKKAFQVRFEALLASEPMLKELLLRVFINGTAYVVGGYFRDVLNNKQGRDIDIIVELEDIRLLEIINDLNCTWSQNRHGGIKIQLNTISVDLWSLENNWAFKNNLVRLNEKDKLISIAKGCFFNYDSLVINLHSPYKYNIQYYNQFCEKGELDILQKKSIYKNLNPTVEANIIRAFFLKHQLGISFSPQLTEYIVKKMAFLGDQYGDGIERVLSVKFKYPKYNTLTDEKLSEYIISMIEENNKRENYLFPNL